MLRTVRVLKTLNTENSKHREAKQCHLVFFKVQKSSFLFYFSQKLLDIWPMYQGDILLGALPFSSDQISLLFLHSPPSFSNIDMH
jgi:hypothetical protein